MLQDLPRRSPERNPPASLQLMGPLYFHNYDSLEREPFMHYSQVALELYTVRDETQRDFAGTLRRVAEMGYPGVEFAGYGGLSQQAMAALLAETGLKVPGTHVGLDLLTGEHLDASIAYCRAIDCPLMVLPSLPQAWRTFDGI